MWTLTSICINILQWHARNTRELALQHARVCCASAAVGIPTVPTDAAAAPKMEPTARHEAGTAR